MHQARRYWVEAGRFSPAQAESVDIGPANEGERFRAGQVRITTGELGTEIKWTVISPCTSSLFAVCDWTRSATGPFVLRFFASGWFEEFHDNNEDVEGRVNDIIARGDRHFTCRTIVKEFDFATAPLSPFLRKCITDEEIAANHAVECVFEDTSQKFHVERVGVRSTIRRIWGPYLSTFPCRSAGGYGETVSKAYSEVIASGKARYDHVLAAMPLPNEEIFWVPYQRLLLPKIESGKRPSVLVFTEIGKIAIQLI